MVKRAFWANFITVSNLFFGYWAILMVSQARYTTACWLIVVAAILDGLDGFVARLTRQSSPFGAEIDSFADSISFGLAPSILIYNLLFYKFGVMGLIFSFLPTIGGVFRLARYNLTAGKNKPVHGFIGMPIPSVALIIAGYVLYARTVNDGVIEPALLLSLMPAVTLLMVSHIPFRRMPVIPIQGGKYPALGAGFLIALTIAVLWNPGLMLFPIMLVYMVTGPIEWLVNAVGKIQSDDGEKEKDYRRSEIHLVRLDKRMRRFFR